MTYLEEVAEKLGMNGTQCNGLKTFIAVWAGLSGLSQKERESLLNADASSTESFEEYVKRLNNFGQIHIFKKFRGTGERANMETARLSRTIRKKLSNAIKKMGSFENNFPSLEEVHSDDLIVVLGAAQVRFKDRMHDGFELADMRRKLKGSVSQQVISLAGKRPLQFFSKKNGKITIHEPLIFEIIAENKSKLLKRKVSPKKIKSKALKIFLSLPEEIQKDVNLATRTINLYPYFKDCVATETDLAFVLAKQEVEYRSKKGIKSNYDLVIVDTDCTVDENGEEKRPTTITTLQTMKEQIPATLTHRTFYISDVINRNAQGIEVFNQTQNPNAITVARDSGKKAQFPLTSQDIVNKSVSFAGIINQIKKMICPDLITSQKPTSRLIVFSSQELGGIKNIHSHQS